MRELVNINKPRLGLMNECKTGPDIWPKNHNFNWEEVKKIKYIWKTNTKWSVTLRCLEITPSEPA